MAPVILARAGLRYALKVHGSDLSYTVLPDLERFRPYAERGVREGAAGSWSAPRTSPSASAWPSTSPRHTPRSGSGRRASTPICSRRSPRPSAVRACGRSRRASEPPTRRRTPKRRGTPSAAGAPEPEGSGEGPARERSAWDRDARGAADAVEWFAQGDGARVVFVGKLIVSKGVDLLLAAWPLVHRANPEARLLVVGFGAFAAGLERLWAALAGGDLEPLAELAERGRGLEGGEDAPLAMLGAFLASLPEGYRGRRPRQRPAASSSPAGSSTTRSARSSPPPTRWSSRAPSPRRSGWSPPRRPRPGCCRSRRRTRVPPRSAASSPRPSPGRPASSSPFALDEDAVGAIADRLDRWLALDDGERTTASAALRATVERRWSWRGVASGVLAAAAGELGELPRPLGD